MESIPPRRGRLIDGLLLVGSLAWVVATLLFLVFHTDLENALWILVSGVHAAHFLLALMLLACALVRVRRSPRVAAISAIIIASGIVFALSGGRHWGERTRFSLARPGYERRLQEILQSFERGTPMGSQPGEYLIKPGPPARVAFMWQNGVADNWIGLVYDPTGIVMRANQFKVDWSNWSDPALEPMKGLFGGDIVRTRHLQDNWYICVFT